MGGRTFSYILQVNSTRSERAEVPSYPKISLISWFSLVSQSHFLTNLLFA